MNFKFLMPSMLLLVSGLIWADAPFTVSTNGTEVTDGRTGLIWRRCAEGMTLSGGTCTGTASVFTHEQALVGARDQASSTGVAWRLPNVKELASIADRSKRNPAIDTVAFPETPASAFWSSSPYAGDANLAFGSYLLDGNVSWYYRYNTLSVRLVRSGP